MSSMCAVIPAGKLPYEKYDRSAPACLLPHTCPLVLKKREEGMTTELKRHTQFHAPHAHLGAPFGSDWFGRWAESTARFFGTPAYLLAQSAVVVLWIIVNGWALFNAHWDPYPFILLNLAFSLQAAYAAPLILLAQTRQADRDKAWSDADAQHRQALAEQTIILIQQNTEITEQIRTLAQQIQQLTSEIHGHVVAEG